MVLRIALFLVLFLGLAGAGSVGWIELHQRHGAAVAAGGPPAARVQVLVAARNVPGGSLLQPNDLAAAPIPAAALPKDAAADTPENRAGLTGAMTLQALAVGQPILPAAIIRPGDHGFLAAVLKPGMRAISVGVDAITGTAGLIWPGDTVDLLLTQTLSGMNTTAARTIASETVLSGVRVIAIDQRLVEGASADQTPAHGMAQTVTLEVTPEAAEKVEVAQRLGPLSLAVRSAAQAAGAAAAPPPMFSGDVSPVLNQVRASAGGAPDTGHMRVYQGPGQPTDYQF